MCCGEWSSENAQTCHMPLMQRVGWLGKLSTGEVAILGFWRRPITQHAHLPNLYGAQI